MKKTLLLVLLLVVSVSAFTAEMQLELTELSDVQMQILKMNKSIKQHKTMLMWTNLVLATIGFLYSWHQFDIVTNPPSLEFDRQGTQYSIRGMISVFAAGLAVSNFLTAMLRK